jgi:hypothetical protein
VEGEESLQVLAVFDDVGAAVAVGWRGKSRVNLYCDRMKRM